jgi:hypothetical protein
MNLKKVGIYLLRKSILNNKLIARILIIALIGVLISIGIAKSSLAPPPHKYFVSGYVQSDTLIDLSNFTIQMYAKMDSSVYEYSADFHHQDNFTSQTLDLTDNTGFFSIETMSFIYHDSIKVGIVTNSSTKLSKAYHVDKSLRIEISDFFEVTDMDGSGCNGCSVDGTEERIVRYEYRLDEINIQI